ncbi:hypothetical protein ACSDQ9_11915 [Aestuariimicrobium soli]|uniref:hypothetical protein n=1 Tax=Aestuariimicrobium soli TaxID=2035834 RepID=UPI003EBFD76B
MPDVHTPQNPGDQPFKNSNGPLDDAWQSFGSDAQGVPMLEAREVRRLGDRRRATRRATIAGATLGVAVLAGAGVVLGTGGFQRTTGPDIAGSPSQATPSVTAPSVTAPSVSTSSVAPSATSTPSGSSSSAVDPSSPGNPSSPASQVSKPAVDAITSDNLPTNQEIYLQKPGDVITPMVLDELGTASEEQTFWLCENGLAQQPGIVAAKTAIFTNGSGTFTRAHLIQLGSAAQASALADTIRGWNDTCPSRVKGAGDVPAKAQNEKTTTVDGVRVDFSTQMIVVDNEEGLWNGVLVLVDGDRVMVIAEFARGMDYNSVGPAMHAENPDLPLVNTARQLDAIIARLRA